MGRSKASDTEREFRAEIAAKFAAAMKQQGFKTQSAAARALGVKRQSFSQYLAGNTTPQAEVLARAVTLWKLKLRVGNHEFTHRAFTRHTTDDVKATAEPFQLALFDQPQRFENKHVVVMLEHSQEATLQVTIRMKKTGLNRGGRSRNRRAL